MGVHPDGSISGAQHGNRVHVIAPAFASNLNFVSVGKRHLTKASLDDLIAYFANEQKHLLCGVTAAEQASSCCSCHAVRSQRQSASTAGFFLYIAEYEILVGAPHLEFRNYATNNFKSIF